MRRPPPTHDPIIPMQNRRPAGDIPHSVADAVHRFREALQVHMSGRVAEAAVMYRDILERFPDHPDVNHYLGMAEYQRGDAELALRLIRRAIALEPGTALFHLNLGRILLNAERFGDAVAAFQNVLDLTPDDADALHLYGRALRLNEDPESALPFLERACALRPESDRIALDLGETQAACRQHSLATRTFRGIVSRDPGNAEALRGLADSYRALNRSREAVACLDSAAGLQPDEPRIWCEHGGALEEAGQFDAAVASFNRALQLRPDFPLAVARLLALRKGIDDPALVASAETHLREQRITKPVRVQLHFALGRHFDATADFDAAFAHYRAANDVVAVGRRYRKGDMERRFDSLIAAFDRALFDERREHGNDSRRPVFIVGMPRSGTTLTEQVLSSHAEVAGAGELGYFMRMAYALAREAGDARGTFAWVRTLPENTLRQWAEGYTALLDEVSPSATRVTDKMPLNFLNLGLIALSFPRARVIHCIRDPMDNCLSCYVENMHQDQRYSTKLESLGHFYRQYHRLMAHWRETLPIPLLDVRYEELVNNFEAEARRMVAFCDLEWDESCMRYYESERSVTTPSKWQVRQPIYRSSVARWRRYEKYLTPLRAALAPLLNGGPQNPVA
jgi:tetratricopeptide (TPR) repeat protein